LKNNYTSLQDIITGTEEIYGEIFNSKIFLEQLVYFDDLNDFEIIPFEKNKEVSSKEEVEKFLVKSVKDYFKKL
jgi:hypothetical protein